MFSIKGFLQVLKGIIFVTIIILVSILIFALIVKLTSPNTTVIKIVNQIIKTISIFVASLICIKESHGLFKGAIIGFFGIIVTYLIFSIFNGSFFFSIAFFIDILFGTVIGAISGIISINIKKKIT